MKSAVIVYPGSNCDRDVAVALEKISGKKPEMIWHRDTELPELDLIVIPGGFSYGDYLRSGAMASRSPIMREVVKKAEDGIAVLGICNGFQVLTEAGLLPGALMRNANLRFICRDVALTVETTDSAFTKTFSKNEQVIIPIAHHDGNYFADDDTLNRLEGDDRVAFKYDGENPNGSSRNIAGIFSRDRRILGMMPHPERAIGTELGGTDGRLLFESLVDQL
ncbi:MAG: phosphoribosylformylglycinamidine synthase subunit PurQ [Alphaproteobacteria bacterium]|nr:phosphoribosylformylglycinamidine synthase subunit PurQ [Alphaproteobacteria bacterium]